MTQTTGTVDWVKVNNTEDSDSCFFQIIDSTGGSEFFVLWWLLGGVPLPPHEPRDRPPSASLRLLWTSQLSLLRDAFVAQTPVTIYHDDTSAFVRTVQLGPR